MAATQVLVIVSIVLCIGAAVGMVPLWPAVLTLALSLLVR